MNRPKTILLTGVAGTGKSTIGAELNKRGIPSIDFKEIPNLCYWQNIASGERVPYTPVTGPEWFNEHARMCDLEMLKKIIAEGKYKVFTGIASGNQDEYIKLFDKVILLQASPENLIERLQTRDSSFGKTKFEQEDNNRWRDTLDPHLISLGAIPLRTDGSLEDVTDRVVAEIS